MYLKYRGRRVEEENELAEVHLRFQINILTDNLYNVQMN